MGRKVFVTSDMSVDERLVEVAEENPQAALIWPWLLTAFDDWGRAEAMPKRLKARVFPMIASVTADDIQAAIGLFAEKGLIALYEIDGKQYIAIEPEKWFKYQTHIKREKRARDGSRYPAPPPEAIATSRAPARTSATPREVAGKCVPSPTTLPPFHPTPSPQLSKTPLPHEVDSTSADGGGGGNEILRQIDLTHHRSFGGFMSAVTRDKVQGLLAAGMDSGLILKLFENAAMDRKPAAWAIRGLERMLAQGILVPEQSESRRRPPIREDPIDPEALEAFRRFSDKASSQEGRPP